MSSKHENFKKTWKDRNTAKIFKKQIELISIFQRKKKGYQLQKDTEKSVKKFQK